MIHNRQLRGVELRYALTMYLFQHGPQTAADLIDALEFQSFDIPGRASKVVSDALRSATEYRIHQRVLAFREEAAVIASRNDDSFWDALGASHL